MTTSKIPRASHDVGRLSDVFISAHAAISDHTNKQRNRLGLPKLKSAVCVLVDGLGVANLSARAGHAPVLSKLLSSSKPIRCEFPSTTVVSIAGFATGTRSNQHGLYGYNVLEQEQWKLVNLLTGWEHTDAAAQDWKSVPTIAEQSVDVVVDVVAHPDYEFSGFTSLTMAGAKFHGVLDLEARVHRSTELGSQAGHLVYLYIPELDQLGHKLGSSSSEWALKLEVVDAALRPLLMHDRVPVLLTADHGMVDVPIENQIHLETLDALAQVDFIAGGDTRSSYLYFAEPQPQVADALAQELGDLVWVCHWQELIDAGFVAGAAESGARRPDLVVMARKNVTLYDRRTCKPRSLLMLGHHGSITDDEMRVPLIYGGALR